MAGAESGHGVQVVSVNGDEYQLNEEALQRVLLRGDVKDLPVVVISIAGAYRGGKSFMLSFFIRYLQASVTSRSDGSWLGANNTPLRGFDWRGGMERHTTGILIWSEPILATLPTGDKVVIILMDTQGSFDSHSTIRDNSSIFAVSTLLSSVQIYNVSQNIREDDLNNLELFSEFGKLVQNTDEEAFQVLQFLIRDWCNPSEYAYGSKGGNTFLDKKLMVKENMPIELRNIRQKLRSSFETISCFLMPHPGFNVAREDFCGCIADIREEFRASLLEFVPLILDPINLKTKKMYGHTVKAGDLFFYFKSYMTILNDSDMPLPTSTLKAMTEANMLTSMKEARKVYDSKMESECGKGQPNVSLIHLREIHRTAVLAALTTYRSQKTFSCNNDDIEVELTNLRKELENCLLTYTAANETKIQEAITASKAAYEEYLSKTFEIYRVCMQPSDLEHVHNKAVEAAFSRFKASRRILQNETWDDVLEIVAIKKYCGDRLEQLRSLNKQNIDAALSDTRNLYHKAMEKILHGGKCVSPRYLERKHDETVSSALKAYKSKRQRIQHDHSKDAYHEELSEYFDDRYKSLKILNKNNYKMLVQRVLNTYNEHMASVCSGKCLHPNELAKEHNDTVHQTLREFNASRVCDEDDDDVTDEDTDQLIKTLDKRRDELKESNDSANNRAVQAAYNEYCSKMDRSSAPSLASILILPLVIKIASLPEQHQRAKAAALRKFWSKRRTDNTYGSDRHLDNLNQMLSEGYHRYCNPGLAIAREVGIPIDRD